LNNLLLFTVSVTATIGSIVDLSPADYLAGFAASIACSGIMDAAITMDDYTISLTGQVEARSAHEASLAAVSAVYLWGLSDITSIKTEKEEDDVDTFTAAVA
jgi:hypothetical protein